MITWRPSLYPRAGPATGTDQQVGSRSGDNYHDFGEGGSIASAHAICGDSTYYPYMTG
jgi:hypothetical protein